MGGVGSGHEHGFKGYSVTLSDYNPATNRYAVWCPACRRTAWFDLTGGHWPSRCVNPRCRVQWKFEGLAEAVGSGRLHRQRAG